VVRPALSSRGLHGDYGRLATSHPELAKPADHQKVMRVSRPDNQIFQRPMPS
jgi:hypothetical protein